jgi:hypothetical protein
MSLKRRLYKGEYMKPHDPIIINQQLLVMHYKAEYANKSTPINQQLLCRARINLQQMKDHICK